MINFVKKVEINELLHNCSILVYILWSISKTNVNILFYDQFVFLVYYNHLKFSNKYS